MCLHAPLASVQLRRNSENGTASAFPFLRAGKIRTAKREEGKNGASLEQEKSAQKVECKWVAAVVTKIVESSIHAK